MPKVENKKIFTSKISAGTILAALSVITILMSFLLNGQAVLAQGWNADELNDPNQFSVKSHLTDDDQNTYNAENLNCGADVSKVGCFIVKRFVNILIALIGIVSIGIIIFGGLTLVTAAGNDTRLQKGKDMILYAIIGLVIAISSYVITIFVQSVFYS